MDNLAILRNQIDKADEIILKSLAKRFAAVKKIGLWKKKKGIPILDHKRWNKLLESRTKKGQLYGLDKGLIINIYELIHRYALELEEKI